MKKKNEKNNKIHADHRIVRKSVDTFEELNRKSSLIQLRRQQRQQIKDICLGKLFIIIFP